jgi:hypothetical protein
MESSNLIFSALVLIWNRDLRVKVVFHAGPPAIMSREVRLCFRKSRHHRSTLSKFDLMATLTIFKYQLKRVILRFRVKEFDGRDISEFSHVIETYLTFTGRSINKLI